jgi:hypothetical protein
MLSCQRLNANLFRDARNLVAARLLLRGFIVLCSAMAVCRRTADGLRPLGA